MVEEPVGLELGAEDDVFAATVTLLVDTILANTNSRVVGDNLTPLATDDANAKANHGGNMAIAHSAKNGDLPEALGSAENGSVEAALLKIVDGKAHTYTNVK